MVSQAGCAYCHNVDAFAWSVVGSVAGVIGAAVAIAFGAIPLLRERRERRRSRPYQAGLRTGSPITLSGHLIMRPLIINIRFRQGELMLRERIRLRTAGRRYRA